MSKIIIESKIGKEYLFIDSSEPGNIVKHTATENAADGTVTVAVRVNGNRTRTVVFHQPSVFEIQFEE